MVKRLRSRKYLICASTTFFRLAEFTIEWPSISHPADGTEEIIQTLVSYFIPALNNQLEPFLQNLVVTTFRQVESSIKFFHDMQSCRTRQGLQKFEPLLSIPR